MATKKRYVVREGKKKGIFDLRNEVQPLVSGVKGTKYKSFSTLQEAEIAFNKGRESYYQPEKKWNEKDIPFVKKSIAVDAACSSLTGIMEYQGVDLVSEKTVFSFSYPEGTNNIGEFLALVHGLSWLEKEKKSDYVLYSDSRIAISWVQQGKCKTNFSPSDENIQLFQLIKRAEEWLASHPFRVDILKWNTKERGEIPADFGRK